MLQRIKCIITFLNNHIESTIVAVNQKAIDNMMDMCLIESPFDSTRGFIRIRNVLFIFLDDLEVVHGSSSDRSIEIIMVEKCINNACRNFPAYTTRCIYVTH